jgi:CyaY protein
MTESEFMSLSEGVLQTIQNALDDSVLEQDNLLQDGVLTIELDHSSPIIVTRHVANQEIWLAARSGGYHYAYQQGSWKNTRSGEEFFANLAACLSTQSGMYFSFTA